MAMDSEYSPDSEIQSEKFSSGTLNHKQTNKQT